MHKIDKKQIISKVIAKLTQGFTSPDVKLTDEQYKQIVEDNIISAIEGGSNYWYWIEKGKWNAGAHIWDGTMVISNKKLLESEPKEKLIEKKLDTHSIGKGWEIFKNKYPKHYQDAVSENGDAHTGDILLQCIVLGHAIYG